MLAIDPDWLLDAFGLAEFDPVWQHQGPFVLPDGRLEIRTLRQTPDGPAMKITRIQPLTGIVVEQYAYDSQGQLVAGAVASDHRRDPLTGLVMPRIVDLQVPRAQFSLRVNLGNVTINGPIANAAELWTMPSYEGWPLVDLGDPRLQAQMFPPPQAYQPPQGYQPPAQPHAPQSTEPPSVYPGWSRP
jgi:hypothetical protein